MPDETKHVPPAIYEFIFDCQDARLPENKIVQQLENKGIAHDQATRLVDQMAKERSQALNVAGKRNCMYGAMWTIGSAVAIGMLYSLSEAGSTRAYAAVGCSMLFGMMLLARGMYQMRSS